MDTNGKYIVFKREDFFQMMGAHLPKGDRDCAPVAEAIIRDAEANCLQDAHVIREQDIFAAPVLYAYASAVQTAIEVLGQQGGSIPGYLYNARDHFFEAASSAEARKVKRLPDA